MENIGVMLAAGEATRLPYKPLLPLRDGHRIAIESGLELLYKNCRRVIVVQREKSLIEPILKKRRWHGLEFCTQQGDGVVAAIASARAYMLITRTDLSQCTAYVTFCDNVFSDDEVLQPIIESTATVRGRPGGELDRYEYATKQWVERGSSSIWALAGWYALRGTMLPNHHGPQKSIEFLNEINARPLKVELPWWDIGTVESYASYMNGGK